MLASTLAHGCRNGGAANKGFNFPHKSQFLEKTWHRHENLKMIVLVLDHHPIASDMVSMLILRVCPAAKIFTANTFNQLDALMRKHHEPDFIFIEPQSTGFSGNLSLDYVARTAPNTKIIAITDINSVSNPTPNISQGFWQVLDKTSNTAEIILELENIINPENNNLCTEDVSADHLRISKRHRQLIHLLDKGLTNREIAKYLGINESTVKVHFTRMFKILNVKNRLQALHFAKRNGLIL